MAADEVVYDIIYTSRNAVIFPPAKAGAFGLTQAIKRKLFIPKMKCSLRQEGQHSCLC